jgi:DNA-binding transcriptional MerR regulator
MRRPSISNGLISRPYPRLKAIDAISASEAKKQLGIDSGRFNYWVKKGLIEQVARQGKIVYYKKSDVDALEAQIEALLLAGTSEEAMAVYRERYHNWHQ